MCVRCSVRTIQAPDSSGEARCISIDPCSAPFLLLSIVSVAYPGESGLVELELSREVDTVRHWSEPGQKFSEN